MSGARRVSASASGFNPLAFMCSALLSSSVESVPSSGTKVSIAIEYMVKLTGRLLQDNRTAPAPEHSAQSAGRPRMDVFDAGCCNPSAIESDPGDSNDGGDRQPALAAHRRPRGAL